MRHYYTLDTKLSVHNPTCLNHYTVTSTAVAMKQTKQQTSIGMQRLGKHVPAAMNMQATIEGSLEHNVFYWVRPEATLTRIPGQLRVSWESAVKDNWEEMATR
jgi:hypothetical protein